MRVAIAAASQKNHRRRRLGGAARMKVRRRNDSRSQTDRDAEKVAESARVPTCVSFAFGIPRGRSSARAHVHAGARTYVHTHEKYTRADSVSFSRFSLRSFHVRSFGRFAVSTHHLARIRELPSLLTNRPPVRRPR